MKENLDGNAGSTRKRADEAQEPYAANEAGPGNGFAVAKPMTNAHAPQSRLDAWSIFDLFARRWYWMVLGSAVCGGAFFLLGDSLVKAKFTANAQLLRVEPISMNEATKPTPMSSETFSALIKAPELLREVGDRAVPPIPPAQLVKYIKIDPEPDSDIVKVALVSQEPRRAVELLNIYITNAVEYTKKLQKEQSEKLANDYLKLQVNAMDRDIKALQDTFRNLPAAGRLSEKMSQVGENLNSLSNNLAAPRMQSAYIKSLNESLGVQLRELNELLVKYKETHPLVMQKQATIDDLNTKIEIVSTNANAVPKHLSLVPMAHLANGPGQTLDPDTDIIHIKMRSLEDTRQQLVNRQREAEAFAANPPGIVRVFAPANLATIQSNKRMMKVVIVAIFGALLGFAGSLGLVVVTELTDKRLKTADDVKRVTKLPVLTVLGDLGKMKQEERQQWAFRTWTMLQGRLSPTPNHGLVCGITSSSEGEGRSTWISLMAEAASSSGFRVLTISTKPSTSAYVDGEEDASEDLEQQLLADGVNIKGLLQKGDSSGAENGKEKALVPTLNGNVLASPSKVTEQLTGPDSQPMVHIPLPGWVWNLERRKQWREALNQWRKIDNLVILVELPPASRCEAVLLGSNLPNLLWLSESNSAEASKTREQLATLRHARCNLVGAVVNRDAAGSVRRLFPRWVESVPLILSLSLLSVNAQEANPAPAATQPATANSETAAQSSIEQTNRSFSVVGPAQRADWQKRLTLGPGDVLDMSLYGAPETVLKEVAIPPDGHLNYLEAANVPAAGLTIDELRAKMDEELGKYRRAPRTIITPVAFRSKKYYMLGKVMTKGVYTLDRPITVLEAIARAHGLENGLVDRNVIDLADFQRSFLMRGGKRIALNFEKLFQEGDLSQNMPIEPGDYLYFPSSNVSEVYVVGEVRLPGTVSYHHSLTIMKAIAARGGYTERAYKARVVVVRGSLNNPEKFAVDTHAILDGEGRDFKLQAKDIIFVNSRPFIRVEELLDLAATAFIQSLVTSWVGVDVVKPIQ